MIINNTNESVHFFAWGIVDKNDVPLIADGSISVIESAVHEVVEIMNVTSNLNADERAPYRVVKLSFE